VSAARVAVTGVGIVSALGQSASGTFGALISGARGIAPIQLFDPGDVRSRLVGEVRDLRIADAASGDDAEDFSRTDAMAVLAAREAAAQARLPVGARLGVVLGGTTGGMFETEGVLSSPERATLPSRRAARLLSYPLSASLPRVAAAFGGVRISRSICSACSGGAIALVQAAGWLARGEVDYVLAGGADGLCHLTMLGFNALGATDPALCRPFDRARAGLNLGEGAAVLVLERQNSAEARGAEVLAWLDGFAVGAEAHHITHPDPSGACALRLMRRALERAGRTPAEIDYVNAHGTGTLQNDAMEGRALLELLGPAASAVWVSSSKAQLGHSLGASGAIEAAITVMALSRGELPPTAGLVEPEVAELRHVREAHTRQPLVAALSSSFGFGGMSCVLALAAPNTPAPPAPPRARRAALVAAARLDAATELQKDLDPVRSRRFDRASSFASVGATLALAGREPSATGLVLGTAFGNVERTMAFLTRAEQKGPRYVAPAEFPHLVPSAPAGNASVYAGLSGPVFAVSDLAQSGEAAFCVGVELIELGVAERVLVGAVAPRDAIVERVLGPLYEASNPDAKQRGEGAGVVLLEACESAPTGAVSVLSGRFAGPLEAGSRLEALPPPAAGAQQRVLLAASSLALREALERSAWAGVARTDLAAEYGYHEALGAVGLALACELLAVDVASVLLLSGTAVAYQALLLEQTAVAEG
jgi:3-oxoacyl-[acyl-carrier-protein] synthase II